jgi:SAM-dependent methyltransferase
MNQNKADRVLAIRTTEAAHGAPARRTYLAEGKAAHDTQRFFQRWPRLYALLKAILTPTATLRSWRSQVPDPGAHLVVNLGAGTESLHPQMINVDFVAFPHVDIVADFAEPLPIRSGSTDAVVSISVFEHLEKASFVVDEVARILKPGGTFYLATPFQYPYHGAPNDFTRWTLNGLGLLLGDQFEIVKTGSRGGPMGVVILALAHAVAQLGCFGFGRLYSLLNFAMLGLLSPLKLLDLLFERLPFQTMLCTGYFVTARKKFDAVAVKSATKAA